VTLIITGGLRLPADYVKAMALGADAVALANAPMQAIGCLAMRACHTNNCPVGIATQKDSLRARLKIQESAEQLCRFFLAATELMQVMARACGHDHLNKLSPEDLTTFDRDMAHLAGIPYAGLALG
jgi:glutamate synthase domain-containing protein 2